MSLLYFVRIFKMLRCYSLQFQIVLSENSETRFIGIISCVCIIGWTKSSVVKVILFSVAMNTWHYHEKTDVEQDTKQNDQFALSTKRINIAYLNINNVLSPLSFTHLYAGNIARQTVVGNIPVSPDVVPLGSGLSIAWFIYKSKESLV